ncbi:DUF6221 family protein [Streptomyces sp.]|uniref:DUF6221 family protein n=1 Tax=Streptomyces sp. TaxID=1931 RepID=UPI002F934683
MTNPLIAFLNARLDDDEAPARRSYDEAGDYDIRASDATLDHFANWKPERVLAEVAAKRKLLERVALPCGFCLNAVRCVEHDVSAGPPGVWRFAFEEDEQIARLLAEGYAWHEDFDEGWRV